MDCVRRTFYIHLHTDLAHQCRRGRPKWATPAELCCVCAANCVSGAAAGARHQWSGASISAVMRHGALHHRLARVWCCDLERCRQECRGCGSGLPLVSIMALSLSLCVYALTDTHRHTHGTRSMRMGVYLCLRRRIASRVHRLLQIWGPASCQACRRLEASLPTPLSYNPLPPLTQSPPSFLIHD